jgi:hypothetical protein
MGIAVGDADDNGFLDLFVTGFEGETNTLYLHSGADGILDRTDDADLAHSSYDLMGWGTQFADLDADGDLDVALLNGHLHGRKMVAQLFLQTSQGRFAEVSSRSGDYFQAARMGRGLALADWNRDARPDLVASERKGPAVLLRNGADSGTPVSFQLAGRTCSRDAVGARVTIQLAGGRRMHRHLVGGGGYLCTNEPSLWYGLGSDSLAQRVDVAWPDGRTDTFRDVPAGTRWLIEQGAAGKSARLLLLP